MELPDRIHLIGPGGVGISALARLLLAQGKHISGTEDNQSPETLDFLRAQGVEISLDLEPSRLPVAECYIYSDAWPRNHPDIIAEARSRSVPMFSYYEALGHIANQSDCLIAVSGAHGKTSTTAMLIDVLEAGGLDPTAIVGSLRAKTKSNFRAGSNGYFIVEADEYMRHFLNFQPNILVITNIDADHLDYYRNLADVQSAFRELVQKVPNDGFIICDPNDPNVAPVVQDSSAKVIDYQTFYDSQLPMKVLPLQRINAAAVLAVAQVLGIDQTVARNALAEFSGTWRRFEYKGKARSGAVVYDDYGHHPKEIALTLASIRQMFPDKQLVVAFQPHLYSRTKLLLDDFATCFKDADEVFLAPIFAAREETDPSISSEILARKIIDMGTPAYVYSSIERLTQCLTAKSAEVGKDGLILTMGAGELYKVAEELTV